MNFLSVTSLLFVSLNRPSNRAQNNRVFDIKIIRKPPMPYVLEVLNVHMNESKKNLLFFRTIFLQTVKIVYFDKRPKRAVGALHFYTSSQRIARVASCIEPYFSLQIYANPSWLTVYRHRKCAATQLHSTAVNTTILTQ